LLKKIAANNKTRAKNKAAGRNDNSCDQVKKGSFDSSGLATYQDLA
jgi:hypothetical protein